MWKVLKFLLVALMLLGSQTVVEAKVSACVEYDANRTLEGFKTVILTWKNPFIKNSLWPEYIRLVNSGLEKAGKPLLSQNQEEAIKEIMENTVEYGFSWYDPADFENGAKVNGVFEYRDIPGQESPWAVYEKYGVRIMYAKVKCCNPQRPRPEKEKEVTKSQPTPVFPLLAQTLNLNIGFKDTLVIKHTFDPIHLVFDNQPMVVPKTPEPYQFVPDTTKTKWYQTTVAKVVGGALLIYGGYELAGLLNKKSQVVEKKPDPIIVPPVEPRTMPPGIPGTTTPTTPDSPGGIPSDPRTQPGGIPGVEIPSTPEPETPSTPGLDSEPRGMPGGISGKIVTVGIVLPAPWGRR